MSSSIGRDDHCGTRYKKGQWTPEEDVLLMKYIETHGEGKSQTLPQKAGLQRCGKGCRLRWKNYLRPTVKRGNISLEEEDLIIRLHKLLGNRWSLIARRIPGRTHNEIKNYWNSHLSKKLRRNIILETTNRNRASSSPSDQLHNETLYRYGHCSLPDTKIDSQRQGDQLKSNHFDISSITESQIDPSNHMACQFQWAPHAEVESQYLSAKHDVHLSSDAWLQQPLPPVDQLYDRNGQVFHSMVAKQPEYCSSTPLLMGGCYDEIWHHNDLGSDIHGVYAEICDLNDMSRTEIHYPLG